MFPIISGDAGEEKNIKATGGAVDGDMARGIRGC